MLKLRYILFIICLSSYLSSGPQDLKFFDGLQTRGISERLEVSFKDEDFENLNTSEHKKEYLEVRDTQALVVEGVCSDLALDKRVPSKLEENSKLKKVSFSVLGGLAVVATALGFIFRERLFLSPIQRELKIITKMAQFEDVFNNHETTPAYQGSKHAAFIQEKLKSGDEADILAAVYMMVKDLGLEDEVKLYSDFYTFANDGQEIQICNRFADAGQISKGYFSEDQKAYLNTIIPKTLSAIKAALEENGAKAKLFSRVEYVNTSLNLAKQLSDIFEELSKRIEIPDVVKEYIRCRVLRFKYNTTRDIGAACELVTIGMMVCNLLKKEFEYKSNFSLPACDFFDKFYMTGSTLIDIEKIKINMQCILENFKELIELFNKISGDIEKFTGLGECLICFELLTEIAIPGEAYFLCGHYNKFHTWCINGWAAKDPSCPYCRAPIGTN